MILASSGLPGGPLGGFLGRLGGLLGASWAVLGHLEAILSRLGCILGRLGGILGPSAPSWRPSWRPSSAYWRPLGPSWGPHRAPQGGPIEGPKSAPMATAPRPKMAPIFPWSSHLGSASFHGSTSELQKGRSGHVVRLQHWSCAKQLVRDRHQHGRPNAACWAYVARSRRPSARCEFV